MLSSERTERSVSHLSWWCTEARQTDRPCCSSTTVKAITMSSEDTVKARENCYWQHREKTIAITSECALVFKKRDSLNECLENRDPSRVRQKSSIHRYILSVFYDGAYLSKSEGLKNTGTPPGARKQQDLTVLYAVSSVCTTTDNRIQTLQRRKHA